MTTQHLPGSSIEIVADWSPGEPPRHALFDFDGTLSLIREGWPDIMIPLMVEILAETGTDETPEQLREIATAFVMELNGKQTIYQMSRLAEEVERRGGRPRDPLAYKHAYHERLMHRIHARRERLRDGSDAPSAWLVPGSIRMLELLQAHGVLMYLASGTDEVYVREEVELLGLNRFFGDHVYGALDDYRSFSKAQIIARLFTQQEIPGSALIGFGDGYVEIQNVREVGGTAVAVASDESSRGGKPDPWKRERLINAGANVVVADFSEAERLLGLWWPAS